MFLNKLFKYHKLLFVITCFLWASFLFINYKWGAVASPLSHYGMYSGRYFLKDSIKIYSHFVNGQKIESHNLSIIENDLLQSFPASLETVNNNNKAVFFTMLPYLKPLGLATAADSAKFIQRVSFANAKEWYRKKLKAIVAKPVNTVKVYEHIFLYRQNKLVLYKTHLKFYF